MYSMSNNSSNRDGSATKQAVKGRDTRGRFTRGNVPSVGFHTHPERRSNGSWKKEHTPRAKLEKMFADMTVGEFLTQINDENVIANLDAKIGDVFVSERLANLFEADREDSGKLKVNSKEFDSLMYYVYGRKTESTATVSGGEAGPPLAKRFVLPTAPEDFLDAA